MLWFNDKVKDHFQHPRNYGPMTNPDAVGEIGNKICGDRVRLFLRLDDTRSVIDEAKFQVKGCPTAIAASSAMTVMITGKTLDEASTIRDVDISENLGGYPPDKMHCCTMAERVLKAALVDAGAITGQAAEKAKQDAVYLSFNPGGTQETLARMENDSKELGPIEKLQLILKMAEDIGIIIFDIKQSPGKLTVILKDRTRADELKKRLNMSIDDEIIIQ